MLQGEKGAEGGTPHLQGFCIMEKNQRLSAMKKIHPTAHWEIMKGSIEDSEKYCTKEDTADAEFPPVQWGEKGVS